jgi:hypothetical protein
MVQLTTGQTYEVYFNLGDASKTTTCSNISSKLESILFCSTVIPEEVFRFVDNCLMYRFRGYQLEKAVEDYLEAFVVSPLITSL